VIGARADVVVLDTSFTLEMLIKTPLGELCLDRVADEMLHAPHLLDVECAHALRRLVRFGGLTLGIAQEALGDLRGLVIERHEHKIFLPRIWQLRDSVSAYDASYIALAEALDAPLLTCDAKLSRAHGHHARIVLLQ
jgi:predicted nucleic acid-binding protein